MNEDQDVVLDRRFESSYVSFYAYGFNKLVALAQAGKICPSDAGMLIDLCSSLTKELEQACFPKFDNTPVGVGGNGDQG